MPTTALRSLLIEPKAWAESTLDTEGTTIMDAITLDDARRRLDRVAEEAETGPVYITRPGAETLVLLSARELASISETAHLLSTEANRASLDRALQDVREGRTVQVKIDDL